MRNIAILCLLLACALPALAGTYRADEIPNVQRMDRRRYVSDPDGILSPAAVAHIDSVCASLRERGLAQVAVVAVDDIAGGDTFSFAVDLFRSWGVGSAKSNNGLGILLVKDLREIRFVTGGGLEGILPDALCKRIQLNYMLPAFREGDYSAGMVAGVGAAATILEGGEVDLGGDADEDLPAWMIFTIVFGFVICPLGRVRANYYFSRRCPKCRKLTLKQQSQQVLSVTRNYRLVEYTYVCPNCGAVVKRRSRNLRDDNFGGGAGGDILRQLGLAADDHRGVIVGAAEQIEPLALMLCRKLVQNAQHRVLVVHIGHGGKVYKLGILCRRHRVAAVGVALHAVGLMECAGKVVAVQVCTKEYRDNVGHGKVHLQFSKIGFPRGGSCPRSGLMRGGLAAATCERVVPGAPPLIRPRAGPRPPFLLGEGS